MKKNINFEQEIFYWKNKINSLENEVLIKKKVIDELSQNINELVNNFSKYFENYKLEKTNSENLLENQNTSLLEISDKISKLNQILLDNEEKNKILQSDIDKYYNEINKLSSEKTKLMEDILALQNKYKYWSEFEEKFSMLEKKFFERTNFLEKLNQKIIDDFNTCIDSQQKIEESWEHILKATEVFNDNLDSVIENKLEKIQKIKEEYASETEKLNDIWYKFHERLQKIEALRNEEKILQKYLDSFSETEIKNAYSLSIDDLRQKEKSLKEEIINLDKKLEDLKTEILEFQNKRTTSELEINSITSKINELKSYQEKLILENEKIENELEVNRKQLESTKEQLEEKTNEISRANEEINKLKANKSELEETIKKLKEQIIDSAEEINF